jgi:hypothetical protein
MTTDNFYVFFDLLKKEIKEQIEYKNRGICLNAQRINSDILSDKVFKYLGLYVDKNSYKNDNSELIVTESQMLEMIAEFDLTMTWSMKKLIEEISIYFGKRK